MFVGVVGGVGGCWCGGVWVSDGVVGGSLFPPKGMCNVGLFFVCACTSAMDESL